MESAPTRGVVRPTVHARTVITGKLLSSIVVHMGVQYRGDERVREADHRVTNVPPPRRLPRGRYTGYPRVRRERARTYTDASASRVSSLGSVSGTLRRSGPDKAAFGCESNADGPTTSASDRRSVRAGRCVRRRRYVSAARKTAEKKTRPGSVA